MENIAKSTSYGCYLDCDFETAKYPDDKTHIVGLLAEYVYDLEQRILHYDERYIKLWNEIETLRECVSKEFDQEQQIADLEAKLAESEKSKESYRLQNEQHHLQLLQFYSRLGVEAFGADIHEKALETLMIMKEQLAESENQCRECKHLNKKIELNIKNKLMAENCELQKQLAEKEKEIESLKHFKVTIGTMETNQVDISSTTYIDQDKISFAVEQLEIARKLIDELLDNCGDKQYKVWEVFDSQIKQLNEGK